MPWVKGQSGNPSGKRSLSTHFSRLLRNKTQNGEDLIDWGLEFIKNTAIEAGERKAVWVELMSRAFGKVPEVVLTGSVDDAAQPESLATHALEDGLGPAAEA